MDKQLSNTASPAPRQLRPAGFLLLLLLLALPAYAYGPQDILGYRSQEAQLAEQELWEAQTELTRARIGLSGSLEFLPELTYSGPLDAPGEAPELDFAPEVRLNIDYRFDYENILSRENGFLGEQGDLANQIRRDVENALVSYAGFLRAQLNVAEERRDAELAEIELAEAEDLHRNGGISETQLQGFRLELEDARINLRQGEEELRRRRAELAVLGLEGQPTLDIVRFALPEGNIEDTIAYRRLRLNVAREEARYRREAAFDVINDVRISGGYEGTMTELVGTLRLDRGRPGLEIDASYRNSTEDNWFVQLSAVFRLDDRTPQEFLQGAARIEAARIELALFEQEFAQTREERLAEIDLRLEELELSLALQENNEQRIDELELESTALPRRLDDLRATLGELRAEREEAEGDAAAALDRRIGETEGQINAAERASRDVAGELDRRLRSRNGATDRILRDWIAYVRAVGDYLELTDAAWATAE